MAGFPSIKEEHATIIQKEAEKKEILKTDKWKKNRERHGIKRKRKTTKKASKTAEH